MLEIFNHSTNEYIVCQLVYNVNSYLGCSNLKTFTNKWQYFIYGENLTKNNAQICDHVSVNHDNISIGDISSYRSNRCRHFKI